MTLLIIFPVQIALSIPYSVGLDSKRDRITCPPPNTKSSGGKGVSQSSLQQVDLEENQLYDTILKKADLTEADLVKADLRYADLTEANLYRVALELANVAKSQWSFKYHNLAICYLNEKH